MQVASILNGAVHAKKAAVSSLGRDRPLWSHQQPAQLHSQPHSELQGPHIQRVGQHVPHAQQLHVQLLMLQLSLSLLPARSSVLLLSMANMRYKTIE